MSLCEKRRHKQRTASLLARESLIQSKRADELISGSLDVSEEKIRAEDRL